MSLSRNGEPLHRSGSFSRKACLQLQLWCYGDTDCGRLKRIAVILKYNQLLREGSTKGDMAKARQILLEFIDATYSRSLLLEDYIDFFSLHSDEASVGALCAQLRALQCGCWSVAECKATQRHFADRTQTLRKELEQRNLFLELIDTLHFNVFHLTHVGLRVPALQTQNQQELKTDDNDEEVDEEIGDAEQAVDDADDIDESADDDSADREKDAENKAQKKLRL